MKIYKNEKAFCYFAFVIRPDQAVFVVLPLICHFANWWILAATHFNGNLKSVGEEVVEVLLVLKVKLRHN